MKLFLSSIFKLLNPRKDAFTVFLSDLKVQEFLQIREKSFLL